MSFKFPLATSSWDQDEQDAIARVIASDMYSMGPEVAKFETEFAAFMGSKHAIMCNSGSSANLLMVAIRGLKFHRSHSHPPPNRPKFEEARYMTCIYGVFEQGA